MVIYKIFMTDEWADLDAIGETAGAPVDLADGFIHFSTAETVRETAARHFAGAPDLVLASVEADTLGDALVWETSRGGALFPHLYRRLARADVIEAHPLPADGAGGHRFPELP